MAWSTVLHTSGRRFDIGHLYKPATAARLADGIVAFAGAG
jgi:hypothetical protein